LVDDLFAGGSERESEIACEAIAGVEYEVHQHSLGVLDLRTGKWEGERYCIALPRRPDALAGSGVG
jgi:hypothetical protein